jgi:uncharacterized protein involved in propanediol utilization
MHRAIAVTLPIAGLPQPKERASAQLPGTCGELFQGTLDGEHCPVSCPIRPVRDRRFGT